MNEWLQRVSFKKYNSIFYFSKRSQLADVSTILTHNYFFFSWQYHAALSSGFNISASSASHPGVTAGRFSVTDCIKTQDFRLMTDCLQDSLYRWWVVYIYIYIYIYIYNFTMRTHSGCHPRDLLLLFYTSASFNLIF